MILAVALAAAHAASDGYSIAATFDLEVQHISGWTIIDDGSFMARIKMDPSINELSGVYRYDASEHRLVRVRDGEWLPRQADSGAGIASVVEGSTVYHYDVGTGSPVAYEYDQPGLSRFGEWSVYSDRERTRIGNLRTGVAVWDDRSIQVVWADKKRVYTVKRHERRATDSTYFLLEERSANDLGVIRSVRFGTSEQENHRIIGDPSRPPFVIERSFIGAGVEAMAYDVVRQDFTWTSESYSAVFGIQGRRLLVGVPLNDPNDTYTKSSGVECRDLVTGDAIWKTDLEEPISGVEWVGPEIRVWTKGFLTVINSGSGEVVRKQPTESRGVLPRSQVDQPKWKLSWDGPRNVLNLMKRVD
jgi:hypothetical protein